jgi:hypothetical protein
VFSSPTAHLRLLMTLSPTLALGLRAVYLKLVAPCHGERVAMYNRLVDREGELRARGEGFNSAGIQCRTSSSNSVILYCSSPASMRAVKL